MKWLLVCLSLFLGNVWFANSSDQNASTSSLFPDTISKKLHHDVTLHNSSLEEYDDTYDDEGYVTTTISGDELEDHPISVNIITGKIFEVKEVEEEHDILLTCEDSSALHPKFFWSKVGEKKNFNLTVFNDKENGKDISTLLIKSFKKSDEGIYNCSITNDVGNNHKAFVLRMVAKTADDWQTTTYIIAVVSVIIVSVVSTVTIQKCHKIWKQRHSFAAIDLEAFRNGDPDSFNPEKPVDEQTELIPYERFFEYPKNWIKKGRKLGDGKFGTIFKAKAIGIDETDDIVTVAIKENKPNGLEALIAELKVLTYLGSHLNVVNLMGACTQDVQRGKLSVILEYCEQGDLLSYMNRNRKRFVNQINDHDNYFVSPIDEKEENDLLQPSHPFCSHDLICWSYQISRGMGYLAKRKILHGDLAARNVLMDKDNVVKVADFGLSRALFKDGHYRKKSKGDLPFKWMALESIKKGDFSSQSDVWSYGVVLWELFSLGDSPYLGIPTDDIYNQLYVGKRMEKPTYATQEMYEVMRSCWLKNPDERPLFWQLEETMGELLNRLDLLRFCLELVQRSQPYAVVNEKRNNAANNEMELESLVCQDNYLKMVAHARSATLKREKSIMPFGVESVDGSTSTTRSNDQLNIPLTLSRSTTLPPTSSTKFQLESRSVENLTTCLTNRGSAENLTTSLTNQNSQNVSEHSVIQLKNLSPFARSMAKLFDDNFSPFDLSLLKNKSIDV